MLDRTEDHSTDHGLEFDGAEQELQDFRTEFQRVVDDLPAQRAIKDIDKLLTVVDELAGRTVHLGAPPQDQERED